MTQIQELQAELSAAQQQVKDVETKITKQGFVVHNNKVIEKVVNYGVCIDTAYYGPYYDDYELEIHSKTLPISKEDMDTFIQQLNGIHSLEALKEVNDQYKLIMEDYMYLSEQPLSLLYKESDGAYEISGIDVSNVNAQGNEMKYCHIEFVTQSTPIKKMSKTKTIKDGDNYIYPEFYADKKVKVICNFKSNF